MIVEKSRSRMLALPLVAVLLGCLMAYGAAVKPAKIKAHTNKVLLRDTIKIIRADRITLQPEASLTLLVGNVILQQGKTIFKADKATKNDSLNTFEAWGHVHINDADTTNIYSDHLKYFGTPQIANLDGNVRLTDGQATLTTPSLEYNMNMNRGIYKEGGKVVNKKTVITSKEGEYYSDNKDVYFKKNVVVNDPAYNIKTDSLQYNTGTQIATFITMTHIRDSARRSIDTKEGFYNLKTGQAEFKQRPFINDDNKSTLIAENVYLDDNIARAEGNAIAVDSTRGTIIIANLIFQNRLNEAILATQKPVMIIKQDNDSIYVAADTLFSAKLSDLFETHTVPVADTLQSDTNETEAGSIQDSMAQQRPDSLDNSVPAAEDSIGSGKNTKDSTVAASNRNLASPDSTGISRKAAGLIPNTLTDTLQRPDSTRISPDSTGISRKAAGLNPNNLTDTLQRPDSSEAGPIRKAAPEVAVPQIIQTRVSTRDIAIPKDSSVTKRSGSAAAKKTATDSTDRYFEAFHHVRIYSDSMQAVSDSLFYSFKDSTFRLYKDPVVWGKGSQITGDTILLHTKNKQPHWMEAFKNGFMINNVGQEAYNQIKSSRIDAYFVDGGLDSVRAKGSAECIYYMQDDDSAFTGINQNSCDIIHSYFKNKELHKVAFWGNVKGTLYPIRQKKPSEMRLEGFKWKEALRPKTKYELFE